MLEIAGAVIPRLFFILHSLVAVWRVTHSLHERQYALLALLNVLLIVEMIWALKKRKGKDCKWFSPAILLYLICVMPSIWILEVHHHQAENNDKNVSNKCIELNNELAGANSYHLSFNQNLTEIFELLSSACNDAWILGLHQTLLILLIVGKWVLPMGYGITRDEFSQLLLIFVSIAADILEFTTETLSEPNVRKNTVLVYAILGVWSWSMLQFPLHLAVLHTEPSSASQNSSGSLLSTYRADIWNIIVSLFIHDGPFFVLRMFVMIHFKVIHQMLVFFSIKNFLVLLIQIYRLSVICEDYRSRLPH
ncbi:transmembrane protein 26b isoform X1 [Erpetoichthys calabaricus]|uniref:Transmembrane protein 26b n=2 Tax=Erpetoichthys calabaricus TaxID=27687 RepID=A0A8C4RGJ9_ERPCA|nr:transmembrane protein 26b isoform X1 [Erpetoichthys calabaricus]